jgi:hypothetical protein
MTVHVAVIRAGLPVRVDHIHIAVDGTDVDPRASTSRVRCAQLRAARLHVCVRPMEGAVVGEPVKMR